MAMIVKGKAFSKCRKYSGGDAVSTPDGSTQMNPDTSLNDSPRMMTANNCYYFEMD
jgi:hypothetical protein